MHAYFLQQSHLFRHLAQHIENRAPDVALQALFGRTLLGLAAALSIREWVVINQTTLLELEGQELFAFVWPIIVELLAEEIFDKLSPPTAVFDLATGWLAGENFETLFEKWTAAGGAKKHGTKTRKLRIEDIVDLAEHSIGYESTLVITAIAEFLAEIAPLEAEEAVRRLNLLQKRMKYGVTNADSTGLYELGFADRAISEELQSILAVDPSLSVRARLRAERDAALGVVAAYPLYFNQCLDRVAPVKTA